MPDNALCFQDQRSHSLASLGPSTIHQSRSLTKCGPFPLRALYNHPRKLGAMRLAFTSKKKWPSSLPEPSQLPFLVSSPFWFKTAKAYFWTWGSHSLELQPAGRFNSVEKDSSNRLIRWVMLCWMSFNNCSSKSDQKYPWSTKSKAHCLIFKYWNKGMRYSSCLQGTAASAEDGDSWEISAVL